MQTILVDVDDVLLDWLGGFKKFLDEKKVVTNGDRPTKWDLRHWVESHNVVGLIEEFNHSNHFEFLEPMDHQAGVALNDLFHKGFQIYAITSCTDLPSAIDKRETNLESHFGGVFEDVVCLPLGGDKLKTLKQFPRGSFWIEDKYENALAGIHAGHRAILLNRLHNQQGDKSDGIARCDNWSQVHELILNEVKQEMVQ